MKYLSNRARIITFVTLLVTAFTPPGIAKAASIYDDVIQSTGSVHLSRDNAFQGSPSCSTLDITTSWLQILTNPSSWTSRTQIIGGATQNSVLTDWATTSSNGIGWSVVQQHNNNVSYPDMGSPIGDAVYLVFTPTATAQVSFSSNAVYWGPQKQAYMTNADGSYVYVVRMQFDDPAPSGGSDQCTPVISMSLREAATTTSHREARTVAATSTETSNGYSLNPLFINAAINYPPGYEGEIPPSEFTSRYVAMGDSFSSGEGNEPFEYGTDVSSTNGCHRSSQAYPRLIQDTSDPALRTMSFVACSGATTANVTGGQWNEPAQTAALSEDTEVITLTIGGNDVQFMDYVIACGYECGPSTTAYSAMMGRINDPDFKADLVSTYKAILNAAPNADLYVGDYPYLSAQDPPSMCWGLDFSGARSVQIALNGTIADAVQTVRDDMSFAHRWNVHLVQTNASGSPFAGRHLCGNGDTDFHGLVAPPNAEYSLHPNASGQQHYADVFEEVIG